MAYLGRSLRREGVRERPALRVAVALALSLALNVLAGWLLVLAGAFDVPKAPASARVALARIDAGDWEANRAIRGEKAPPARSRPPEETAVGPVVELPAEDETSPEERRAENDSPEKARHSAERDQKVEHESVSRYAGNYPKLAAKPQLEAPRRKEGGQRGDAAAEKPGAAGARGDRLALAPAPFGEHLRGEAGAGGRRMRGKLAPDLSLGPESAAKVLAGPNLDGYRDGLDVGEETLLNTQTFKFATYVNQMRNEIGHEWLPRVRSAQRSRDPDGSMFFYKDRTVYVGITIDADGRVTDASVLESSNVDFFDRVAVDALRAAQPFPNPPRPLLGDRGEAQMVWSFTLVAGDSRPRIRWFGR